jgi:hypothetical protein
MRASFTATTATLEEIEGVVVVDLSAVDPTLGCLLLQRRAPDDPQNWGVYLEYNDQAFSGYDAVASYRLSRKRLAVDLSKPLGTLQDVTRIDIEKVESFDPWT